MPRRINFDDRKIADMRKHGVLMPRIPRTYIDVTTGEDGTTRVMPHVLTVRMPNRFAPNFPSKHSEFIHT